MIYRAKTPPYGRNQIPPCPAARGSARTRGRANEDKSGNVKKAKGKMNMKLKHLKKALTVLLSAATVAGCAGFLAPQRVSAAPADYAGYKDGVTVEADSKSPTGYTATFVYKELSSYTGLTGTIAKVELYSDCFYLFKYSENTTGKLDATKKHTPDTYTNDMYPAGGNGDTTYYVSMENLGNGRWGAKVPLSSGAFVYNYRVTDSNNKQVSRLDDPSNPTLKNTATGIHSLSSMVYVPYNSVKEGTGKFSDRTVETPSSGSKGTVETISYTGAQGDTRGLAVYLPSGYDASRAAKYKVLYLSHGASGDKVGNELRWMNEGCVPNIMDNLSADFVVVTMNNQDLSTSSNSFGFDYNRIWAEQQIIMKLIESKYNVYDTAKGRAFAGLSMGGLTTSNMLINHHDQFSYYGIWSYANTAGLTSDVKAALAADKSNFHVMLGAGEWDMLYKPVADFGVGLDSVSIDHYDLYVPGAHDWETWQQLYAFAVKNFFWKSDAAETTATTTVTATNTAVTSPKTGDTAAKDDAVPMLLAAAAAACTLFALRKKRLSDSI
jgi:enterochelin esterase-like enzyme